MNQVSIQFYLDKPNSENLHRLYARITQVKSRKKIFSPYQVPLACWIKKEHKVITRSKDPEFKGLPRSFSKSGHANDWIQAKKKIVEEINIELGSEIDLSFDQICQRISGVTFQEPIIEKPQVLFCDFLKMGFEEHINQKRRKGQPLSPATIRNYDYYVRKFSELAGLNLLAAEFNQKEMDRITEGLLDDKSYCNTSIRSMYAPIKCILKKSYEISELPKEFSMPQVPSIQDSDYKLKTRLSITQIEALQTLKCETLTEEHARDAFLLAFFGCGMRMSEVIGLRMKYLNPRQRTFYYFAQKQKKISPTYEMSERFWEVAKKYYDPKLDPETFLLPEMRKHSHLFYGESDGKLDFKIAKVRDQFYYYYKIIGKKLNFPEKFSPHSARKTVALYLYETTGDIFKVKELLNHKKIETTIVYLAKNGVRSIRNFGENQDIYDKFYEQEAKKGKAFE